MIELKRGTKTKEWFKDVGDYYMPSSNAAYIDDYDELKKIYEIINNDLSSYEAELNHICNDIYTKDAAIESLLPYNKMKNKLDVLAGDLIKRNNDHKIILLSAKAVRSKNKQLQEKIMQGVEQELAFEVKKAMGQMQQMSEEELGAFIEEYRNMITPTDMNYKNFLTEMEIYKSKMLKHTMYDQDVKFKKITSFKHLCIADRMFLYNGWKHGKPYIKVLNPLFCGFHKSPDLPFVQYGDYFWYMDEMTIGAALDEYINVLNEEQYNELVNLAGSSGGQQFHKDHTKEYIHNNIYDSNVGNFGWGDKGVGAYQSSGNDRYGDITVRRIHLEFKAYEKIIFFTYRDEYGQPITVQLKNNTDIIPKEAEKVQYTNQYFEEDTKYVWEENGIKYEAEIQYIPRRYEMVRLNGMDINCREVPMQPEYSQDPFTRFELSYKGGIVNSMNAKSLSLAQVALPYQLQIYILKFLQNREISSYQGYNIVKNVDVIPDALEQDANYVKIEGRDKITESEIIRRKTKQVLVSQSQSSLGMASPQTSRPVEVLQTGNMTDILNSQQLINLIDIELGIAMGVPPQREAQVIAGTNVADNQQALVQSSLTTEWYYFWHNKVWSHCLNEHLINLDNYYRRLFEKEPDLKEHLFEYLLPDGTKELIKVMPEHLNHNDIGLHLNDSSSEKMYMDYMLNNIQPISQNAGEGADMISTILKSISSGASVEEVDKMIKMAADDQRKRLEAAQKNQEKVQIEIEKLKQETLKYNSDLAIQEGVAKEIQKRITAEGVAAIEFEKFVRQEDVNNNKVNDQIEVVEAEWKFKLPLEKEKLEIERIKANKPKGN